ncbi:MAG: excinuclease ABC subunit UvrC [Candidatus Hydrogenedens sp.]|nr:excinuclease ABC subunit UvrC [Candidatus Hydrogenedens sp.]
MHEDPENTETSPKSHVLDGFDIATVPTGPGCYLMCDAKSRVIYVGKAKNLRSRVRQYLNETDSRYSVKFLMRRVAQINFIVTGNEKEALLLENSLIKQHKPRYNVRLKDDKTYISLRLDPREDFPRITVVRRYKRDGARYFGPYHDTKAARQMLRQITRMFTLRTCTDHVLYNRSRPCLYHQMGQCCAPCVNLVTREAYHEIVEQVLLILEGRSMELEERLTEQIKALAENLEFEAAAALRDRLYMLHRNREKQRAVTLRGSEDRDVFGYYNEGRFTEIQVLFYRGGRMLGGRAFSFERQEMPVEELMSTLILQYYGDAPLIPQEVFVPCELEDADTLAEVLSEQRGRKVEVSRPQRGDRLALVELANKNARHNFLDKRMREKAQADTLAQMQQALRLPVPPERIECFDISTIQGENKVASMAVFTQGEPDKARYRKYIIKTVEGQDDFASMREVILRRYQRAIEEDDLPSLVLIDGGKGQLGVAVAALHDLGLEDLPIASIAKSRAQEEGGRSPERFFLPGRSNPIILPQSGPVVKLAARIRDEAHRFAITFHRKKRGAAARGSKLTEIPGIGPTRAKTLLKHFGSVKAIREATPDLLAEAPGIGAKKAAEIHAALHAGE